MGVDYRVWIIPHQRTFRPTSDRVASLANALCLEGWAPPPDADGQRSQIVELLPGGDSRGVGKKPALVHQFDRTPLTAAWVEFHSDHELVLNWSVHDQRAAGVQYPFSFDPFPDPRMAPYFYLYVILGHDYFYYAGETVIPFAERETRCRCGEQLAYWTGWAPGPSSQRIHTRCPKCSCDFDPSELSCEVLDGWSGHPSPLRGGLIFKFALLVDCHKYYPRDEEGARRFQLRPEFLDLWRKNIGVPFEQIETWD